MTVVVVGTGPAGITAAETIRRYDPTVPLVLLTTEHWPPYSPPAMADHFLTGRREPLFWRGEDVAARLGAEEIRGVHVTAIDPARHEVRLDDGRLLGYRTLVLASGSRLHAPLPGVDLPGVHDFKSLDAAERIIGTVRAGSVRSAVIVGCGFIGVELGLLLADLGVRVTVLGRRGWVMPRMLDPETAAIAERAIRARGVDLRLGVEASAFVGADSVAGVRMADGALLTADAYVAATGVKPHVEFLGGSGIGVGWGVHVDDRMRTDVADVYAAGDVAEPADRITGERFVHAIFPNAVAQGEVVGRNVVGLDTRYEGAETMNSLKHLGLPVVSVGVTEGDAVLRWGDGDVLRSAWLADGRLVGVRLAGDLRGAGFLRTLLLRGDDVRRFGRRLVEPGFGPGDLALPLLTAPALLSGSR